MICVVIYDKATGEIKRQLSCADADLAANVSDGESCVLHSGDVAWKRVVDGRVVNIDQDLVQQSELDAAWVRLRQSRDRLLSKCDWTQVPDAPVDQAAWAAYRQELRDLPSKTDDPFNVVWPSSPNS